MTFHCLTFKHINCCHSILHMPSLKDNPSTYHANKINNFYDRPVKFWNCAFPTVSLKLNSFMGPLSKSATLCFQILIIYISIITQVIIEILALSLAENSVIFRYNHLRRGDYSGRTNFQNNRLALCQCVRRVQ